MFRPMAETVSFAILGAFLLSLTYIPMMSSLFLSKKLGVKPSLSDRMMEKVTNWYTPLLRKVELSQNNCVGECCAFCRGILHHDDPGWRVHPQTGRGRLCSGNQVAHRLFAVQHGGSSSKNSQGIARFISGSKKSGYQNWFRRNSLPIRCHWKLSDYDGDPER